MKNLKIFCISIYNENNKLFKELGLVPVGLGPNKYGKNWMTDKIDKNISHKNIFYGEYTFHYWLWKNYLKNLHKNKWIGFCTYRRFWTIKNSDSKNINSLKKNIISNEPESWKNAEVILAKKILIGKIKFSKIIKNYGLRKTIYDYKILLKNKHTLFDHFKVYHGDFHINKAIKLLPVRERSGFENYLEKFSFNPHNLFICRNVKILKEFYDNIFPWLFNCENAFNMNRLSGYQIRMLGFLAEFYSSYWFQKNFSIRENNITFFDTNKKVEN